MAGRESGQAGKKIFPALRTYSPWKSVRSSGARAKRLAQMMAGPAPRAHSALCGNNLGCDAPMKNNAWYDNTALPVLAWS